jgi:isopentenyl-diphosphate delta-isomerase
MVGFSDEDPKINIDEVASFKWMSLEVLKKDLVKNPNDYTVWFAIIFDRFFQYINNKMKV